MPADAAASRRLPRSGWLVVAAQGDRRPRPQRPLLRPADRARLPRRSPSSSRPSASATWRRRSSGAQAVFLVALHHRPQDVSIFGLESFGFVGIVAPLLGVAFAFDAVNGERAEGTLPRLLSQPIHRDDVINGKFVAGAARSSRSSWSRWSASSRASGSSGWGIVPSLAEVVRLLAWLVLQWSG